MMADPRPSDASTVRRRRVAYVAEISSALVGAIGIASLCGWATEIDGLRGLALAGAPMNPATALLFCLLAIGLSTASRTGEGRVPLRVTIGFTITIAGVICLASHFGRETLPIDRVLFASRLNGNRMEPNSAGAFIFIGLSLAGIDFLVRHRLSTWLWLAAGSIAWFALLGYTLDVASLYSVGDSLPMASSTAAAFMIACIGLACARPDREPVSLFTSDGAAGALSLRLLPIALFAPPIIAWARLQGQRANLFPSETGVSIMVLTTSMILLGAIVWSARVVNAIDVERREAQSKVHEMSLTDELTGLRNRRGFLELARQQLLVARRQKQTMLLCFMDLDGLKRINDVQGHTMGDRAICEFGEILTRTFRESDIVARLGGDEFVVLAVNCEDPIRFETALKAELDHHATLGGPFRLAASIGIETCSPESRETIETLLENADQKMYAQKSKRPDRRGADRPLNHAVS